MKTVFITGDSWITDAQVIMKELEYLFSVKALPEQFKVITTGAEGVEQTIEPVMLEAGFDVTHYNEPPEDIDIVVVLLSEKEERAKAIMIKQWQSRKAVYPFIKVKPQ